MLATSGNTPRKCRQYCYSKYVLSHAHHIPFAKIGFSDPLREIKAAEQAKCYDEDRKKYVEVEPDLPVNYGLAYILQSKDLYKARLLPAIVARIFEIRTIGAIG